ncbi:MAG: ABC transporter permease [Gemmatimonadetes bacterium]|uniref:ABC transporter permease n=1 Tax=Candidatus Kutchimonas denitrificans TaxID=3056748 RepID=A0AAE5CCK5_9BACT|nr:ABC transporter permease [Gemmatimonadota bacterium]NIR76083.1 ABC transporter permease [Candidatus Kutchimonas denitrificans]NIS00462.1 ABC transporter permease [Gemmatimonadota bacterium]NIT66120.1 ABC transporter permease [Gemmatimonadota bacterium]NIU54198.1 FtsX-like permease family protein [Gemmatimonadota bacterium]
MEMKRILRLSFGKVGVTRDVDAEIRFHLEMRAEEFEREGLPPAEAMQAARAAFGDVDEIASECRQIRRRRALVLRAADALRDLGQDLRFAVRSLRKSPGYTAAVLISLALGIGANTATFSLVNGVLIRPLPYEDGDRLVHLDQITGDSTPISAGFSPPEIEDYRRLDDSFQGMVEYHSMSFTLLGLERPKRVSTGVVSDNYFDLFGIEPLLGRTFLLGEDEIGADPVLVLSHDFWQREFDGNPGVVGRELEMNDRTHTVVGVLPPVPQYPVENDVYMPVSSCPFRTDVDWAEDRDQRGIDLFARLEESTSLETAREDLSKSTARIQQSHPDLYEVSGLVRSEAVPLRERLVSGARTRLLVLIGITGFLLLIVCANVANLGLARLAGRGREMAIRTALGAWRGRLFRQLLAEGTTLAISGGALAVLLAWATLGLLVSFVARFTTRAAEIRIDSTVLLFTLGVSLATALVLGLLPALPDRARPMDRLRDGGVASQRGGLRTRSTLVVGQLAVSIVLLVGAGLLIRSFVRLQQVDPGFRAENVLAARISLDWSNYREDARVGAFADSLLRRVEALPGVTAAGVGNKVPLSGQGPTRFPLQVEAWPEAVSFNSLPRVDFQAVSRGYLQTIGVPLVHGRLFNRQRPDEEPEEAVVSQTLAERHFGDQEAIGRQICWDWENAVCVHWLDIVGIAGDVRHYGLDSEAPEVVYLPFETTGWRDFRLVARNRWDPTQLADTIHALVHAIDPTQAVVDVRTLASARRESMAAPRITMLLMGVFAVIALVITATGIAGVIAYAVGQRTHELGIRIALGARRETILWLVLRRALILIAIGLGIGVPAALVLSRFLSDMLFQTPPQDPLTLIFVAGLAVVVALAACYVPARRITAIDPMMTLRTE